MSHVYPHIIILEEIRRAVRAFSHPIKARERLEKEKHRG